MFKIVKRNTSSSGGSPAVRRVGDVYRPLPSYAFNEDALMRFGGRVRQFMEQAGEVDNFLNVPSITGEDNSVQYFPYTPLDPNASGWTGVPDTPSPNVLDPGVFLNVPSIRDGFQAPQYFPYTSLDPEAPGWSNTADPQTDPPVVKKEGDPAVVTPTPAVTTASAVSSTTPGQLAAPRINPGNVAGFDAPDPNRPDLSAINSQMQSSVDQFDQRERDYVQQGTNEATDGDTTQSMSTPYYGGADLGSRAAMLGRSIGRAGTPMSGGARAANIAQGIFSGVSLGMGLARNIAGAASAERARQKDTAAYRQRLAQERRNSFIQYTEEGGDVNVGNGETFNTSSLTGEYLYPLPKSMEDVGNVEVEKGEYILRPDVTGPMESKGHRHEQGGTVVDLPEGTHIISDYRKITPDMVIYLSDNYGIKASVKDTYSSVMDKYKKKIGLKDLYDEQEKVYKRLQKAEDIKDNNTSELSKSVLSGYVAENQSKIDELEPRFRDFADMLYEAQEADKKRERIDTFFRDGGVVDAKKIIAFAKKAKISEERAREIVYDNYRSERKKMAVGGPTEEQMQWGRDAGTFLQELFGRQLRFSPVMVQGTDAILNEGTGEMANQGYQRSTNGMYGRATGESLTNLGNVNRWGRNYLDPNNLDVEGFQTGYNDQMNRMYALASSGAISNAQDMMDFRNQGFWGQSAGEGNIGRPGSAQNSFAVDDKYGQTTATRPFYSLDVLTPEQRRLLNEKDIRNFVDLFGDNADEAKKILGDDYAKFEQMRGRLNGMDFILGEYTQAPEAIDPGPLASTRRDLPEGPNPVMPEQEESNPAPSSTERYRSRVDNTRTRTGARPGVAGLMFPEILREYPGGIITPGLERHQAPHVDPVLRSADQYINELNRATSAQLDALGDVPDSQRAAILANMNAIAGTNIARYINDVDYSNAQQRNYADRFNTTAYAQTDDKNIAERQRYEAGVLQAMAIDDENRARFWDSVNDETQKKWNVATSMNTIASIAPDMAMLPSGQIIYAGRNRFSPNGGDYSTGILEALEQAYGAEEARRILNGQRSSSKGTSSSTAAGGRMGGEV